nr:hypothetical protein [Tanacetum cinerariifolium]
MGESKAKGKERKKKIKSLTKSLDNLHLEVAHLSASLNQATILEAEKDEEILRLKTTPLEFSSFFRGQFQGLIQKFLAYDEFSRVQGELLSLAASARFERGLASLLVGQTEYAFLNKISEYAAEHLSESTVTPASKSLELSANVDLTASVVASEHDEEMVSDEVDGSDPKMTDDTITAKSGHAFVQGMSVVLDDAVELAGIGSGHVSSGLNDVVVSFFAGNVVTNSRVTPSWREIVCLTF